MDVLSFAQAMTAGVGKGSQFGLKGAIAGGVLGLADYGIAEGVNGENNEGNNTLQGSLAGGFAVGSFNSALTSAHELYSFYHPNQVPAFNSLDHTGDTEAKVVGIDKLMHGDMEQGFKSFTLEPHKIMTDVTKLAMLSQEDNIEQQTEDLINANFAGGKNVNDTIKKAVKSPYTFAKRYVDEIKGNINTFDNISSNKYINPDTPIHKQMADYVESHAIQYNRSLDKLRDAGIDIPDDMTVKDVADYFRNMKTGPISIYDTLKNGGLYDKGSNPILKAVGIMDEVNEGSPLWARATNRQIEKGTAKLESHLTDKTGRMVLKGGLPTRLAALAGDVVLGGALGAAQHGAIYGFGKLIHHNRQDLNNIDANVPLNPIGM